MTGGLHIACQAERQQYANFCDAGWELTVLIWRPRASIPPASVCWTTHRHRKNAAQASRSGRAQLAKRWLS